MLKYKIEEKNSYCCEVCGRKPTKQATAAISLKEFHKDGTTKIHYTCSNRIVDLYNKIIQEIENNKKLL